MLPLLQNDLNKCALILFQSPSTSRGSSRTISHETPRSSVTIQNSVIKGYHAYKIRPPITTPSTKLVVEPEYTNIHDLNACLVWLPPLANFPEDIHAMMTDEKRQLRLEDVAGLPIGHVPRSMAGCFRTILDAGGDIVAEATGEPVPSFPPWPEPKHEGGGVVIPANYIITHADINSHIIALKTLLDNMKEGSSMTLVC